MTEYIYVVNWDGKDGFQHYKDREPRWIKNYVRLLDHDEYLELNYHDRAVLHGLWLLTARAGNGRISAQLGTLSAKIGVRVRQLDSLVEAGFIELRSIKADAPVYQKSSPEVLLKEEPKSAASGAPLGEDAPSVLEIDPPRDPQLADRARAAMHRFKLRGLEAM